MKLRKRLAIAFMVIVLVPVVLGAITLFGFSKIETSRIEKTYGLEDIGLTDILGTMRFFDTLNRQSYGEVLGIIKNDPGIVIDNERLSKLNSDLSQKYSYIIVKINGEVFFDGINATEAFDTSLLPEYKPEGIPGDYSLIIGGPVKHIVKQIDMQGVFGDRFSVFVITRTGIDAFETKAIIKNILIMVMMILIITAVALAYWLYRSFVTPLDRLSTAAKNIKEGNLDFTMRGMDTDDEIGQLFNNFEEMRQRLSDQAAERVRFDKENKELISNISHDLKTPITAVKGYCEGILDGVADTPEKMDRYIHTIYNKANEMDLLINELTFYSKIDTNRIPYTFDIINAAAYFNDCAEELEIELENKKFKLEYENRVSPEVRIIADAEQLRRVINNIVGNSIKYMDKEYGLIRLSLTDVGDYIQIDMGDNGKGIEAKDLPYVFDRFYRADSSRSSSKGGSGIGLSIVKKIVEDHGGKIWATSKEGSGTTMSFVIRKYQEVPMHE